MFYLLDQPTEEEFQSLARRYEDMEPSSVKAAVTLLKTGSDLLTGFETMLGRYGVSQGRFLILVVMNRKPNRKTTPSALAKQIGVTRATMTGLLDGLEKDGFIERSRQAGDRRKCDLTLTRNGKRVLELLLPDYWSRIHGLMSGLTKTEEQTLATLLRKVADGIPALTCDNGPRTIRADNQGDVQVARFREEHTKGVVDLIVNIQRNEFNLPITASEQPDLLAIPDFYQTGRGNFWVAVAGGAVVGTIALLDIGEGRAALRKMFVAAGHRGQGTGTAKHLLDTLLLWAKRHEIREIFLGTTPKFLAAHRFYEKNGFVEVGKGELPESFPIMKVDTKFYKYGL